MSTPSIPIRNTSSGAAFSVRVHPGARKSAITGIYPGTPPTNQAAIKVSLNAPPVDGRANDALIAFLARLLQVPRASISITSGITSRNKVICIANHTAETLQPVLAGHLPK